MIRNTFIHLQGVGKGMEEKLWRAGIIDWDKFMSASKLPGISAKRQDELSIQLMKDKSNLDNADYWTSALPRNEHWRLYRRFKESIGCLDIETTSTDPYDYGDISMIGLYYQNRFRAFINGRNMEMAEEYICRPAILVTFNGACFDLPMIKARYPHFQIPDGHIDLRFTLNRLGYRGGLKRIEVLFGISRPSEVKFLDGFEAPRLWHKYLAGDKAALGRLVKYNREDTVNLSLLLDVAYHRLKLELMGEFLER